MELVFQGQLAERAGVDRSTIVFWAERGWIPQPARLQVGPSRSDRVYTEEQAQQVIRFARSRGHQGIEQEEEVSV